MSFPIPLHEGDRVWINKKGEVLAVNSERNPDGSVSMDVSLTHGFKEGGIISVRIKTLKQPDKFSNLI